MQKKNSNNLEDLNVSPMRPWCQKVILQKLSNRRALVKYSFCMREDKKPFNVTMLLDSHPPDPQNFFLIDYDLIFLQSWKY